jgi:hypothetical protein
MLELPAWPLADALALGLAGVLGVVVEAVMARQPRGLTGVGLLLAVALAGWLGSRRRARGRLDRATLAEEGIRLTFADGRQAEATLSGAGASLGRLKDRCRPRWVNLGACLRVPVMGRAHGQPMWPHQKPMRTFP